MQSHGPKRVYTPQSLEFWFEKLDSEWESHFLPTQLEEGRRIYRDGEVRELELTDHDAIVHRRVEKRDEYAVLEWDAVKEFTRLVSTRFSGRAPDRFLVNMSKAKRVGRIFIDYLRNGRGATAIAPYSTRARPGGQIATPISWRELKDGAVPADFTIVSVPQRVAKRFKDPWVGIDTVKQAITVKTIKMLSG